MDWLPSELVLPSSSLEEDYAGLYEVFKRDFIESEVYFRNEKIVFQEAIDNEIPGDYPHGFTHLVTRKNGKQRIIDYDRATKLPWIRAIIEHSDNPAVVIIERSQASEKYGLVDNTYLWLEEHDFLVVLRHIKKGFYKGQMLITAYAITESYERRRLQKWSLENAHGASL